MRRTTTDKMKQKQINNYQLSPSMHKFGSRNAQFLNRFRKGGSIRMHPICRRVICILMPWRIRWRMTCVTPASSVTFIVARGFADRMEDKLVSVQPYDMYDGLTVSAQA